MLFRSTGGVDERTWLEMGGWTRGRHLRHFRPEGNLALRHGLGQPLHHRSCHLEKLREEAWRGPGGAMGSQGWEGLFAQRLLDLSLDLNISQQDNRAAGLHPEGEHAASGVPGFSATSRPIGIPRPVLQSKTACGWLSGRAILRMFANAILLSSFNNLSAHRASRFEP